MVQETIRLSDEYEVSDILGRGGFSVVRRGIKKSSSGENIHVAIKTLKRFGPSSTPSSQNRGAHKSIASLGLFPTWKQVPVSDVLNTNEILVMRKIVENVSPHPNVIDLYDVYEDQDGVHLVLELCSGGELFDRIVAQERYNEAGAAAVVRQIAQGLKALHRANIVHRDLKPENCLFLNKSQDSSLKIMDFGLSSVEEFTDPVVGLFGSIDYVSPEALSQGSVTSKSDMWSLGVILYILLSGYVRMLLSDFPRYLLLKYYTVIDTNLTTVRHKLKSNVHESRFQFNFHVFKCVCNKYFPKLKVIQLLDYKITFMYDPIILATRGTH